MQCEATALDLCAHTSRSDQQASARLLTLPIEQQDNRKQILGVYGYLRHCHRDMQVKKEKEIS